MFRYIVRLHAWRGQPFVRLHYTFLNDNTPELLMITVFGLSMVGILAGRVAIKGIVEGRACFTCDGTVHSGAVTIAG